MIFLIIRSIEKCLLLEAMICSMKYYNIQGYSGRREDSYVGLFLPMLGWWESQTLVFRLRFTPETTLLLHGLSFIFYIVSW